MESVTLVPKYRKGKKPARVRKPSKPIDGINRRLLREQALQAQPVDLAAEDVIDVPADNEAPTRLEMAEKAKDLGLKFTKRTSDKKLLAMINEAIGG